MQGTVAKYKYSKTERREHLQGYLFLSPAILIALVFTCAAVVFVIYLSFHKVNLFTDEYTFVGFENYKRVLTDSTARVGLKNTLTFSVFVVPIQTIISLVVASVLNSGIKGKYFFRSVYFLPTLTSSSALTMIFMFMCSINGPVNGVLVSLGYLKEAVNFLNEPAFALRVIMLMCIWSTVPMYMTLYLASLQDLPASLYEAASIDGAGPFRTFIAITVPYLSPVTTYVLLTGIIGTLQVFDVAYIFSNGSGGPANSTLTISLMVYRYAFGTQNAMGYAATLAIALAVVIFIATRIADRLNKSERMY